VSVTVSSWSSFDVRRADVDVSPPRPHLSALLHSAAEAAAHDDASLQRRTVKCFADERYIERIGLSPLFICFSR